MQKIKQGLIISCLASLGFMLSGCEQSMAEKGAPEALQDSTVAFKKLRAMDEEHQSLDCSQIVSALTPFQSMQAFDYVLHEEEVQHYQFQQCRQVIQEQADAACREATDVVLHDSPVSFSQFEGVHELDKTCLANVKQQVKDGVLKYRIVKKRDPFLVVEGTAESWFNLKKLTRVEASEATQYDEVKTYLVRVNFGEPKKNQFAYDVQGVFPDKASADAFVAALTEGTGSEKSHN
jgi:hypothetical protein